MATPQILWRPPEAFVSGDTLIYQRNLPNYLPSAGFAIQLTVTKPTPQAAKIQAQAISVPDATNSFHTFNVVGFCAGAEEGHYVLSEEVFNAATGERHQISYADDFLLGPDLNDGLATKPIETVAQRKLRLLHASHDQLIQLKFSETEDLRSRFKIQDEEKILNEIKYWTEVRHNEIQMERVRNGQSPGNFTVPIFRIG